VIEHVRHQVGLPLGVDDDLAGSLVVREDLPDVVAGAGEQRLRRLGLGRIRCCCLPSMVTVVPPARMSASSAAIWAMSSYGSTVPPACFALIRATN
jgi:hypothetical protein